MRKNKVSVIELLEIITKQVLIPNAKLKN